MITTVKVMDMVFNVNPLGYEAFWNKFSTNQWENVTLQLINNLKSGDLFIDCGGWIGAVSLAAAAKGSHVIVYEPNPVTANLIRENIALNPGFSDLITLREVALHYQNGTVNLFNNHPLGFKNSRSTISVHKGHSVEASALDIKDAVLHDKWDQATLVKIDIESAEYHLLPRMNESLINTPDLLIEFHPTYFENGIPDKMLEDCEKALARWTNRQWAEGELLALCNNKPFKQSIAEPFIDLKQSTEPNICPKILFRA